MFFVSVLVAASHAAYAACLIPGGNTTPQFTAGGSVFGRIASQWNAYYGAKVDQENGCSDNQNLYNPLINGVPVNSGFIQSATFPLSVTNSVVSLLYSSIFKVNGSNQLDVNYGTSVTNPGTNKLEMVLPVQAVTGTSNASNVTCGWLWFKTRRSNSGSAMSDTLPAASCAGMTNGTRIVIANADASAADTLTGGAGTTITANCASVPAGQDYSLEYDAANTVWRGASNTCVAVVTSVSQAQHTVLAAPSGSSGNPAFRALVSGDLPTPNLIVGTTGITSGTNTRIEYNNAGTLGEYAVSGSGSVCMTTSCSMTTPTLGVAIGTSLALGGATLGSNALAVTGTTAFGGAISFTTGLGAINQLAGPSDTTFAIAATAPVAVSASSAGNAATFTASNATAGTSSAGAAAGGSIQINAGSAARLTSGNAVGGGILLQTGFGIGTGAAGAFGVSIGGADKLDYGTSAAGTWTFGAPVAFGADAVTGASTLTLTGSQQQLLLGANGGTSGGMVFYGGTSGNTIIQVTSTGTPLINNLPNVTTAESGAMCWNSGSTAWVYDNTNTCLASREDLKTISGTIPDPMAKIMAMQPFEYTWNAEGMKLKDDPGNHFGLGAFAMAYVAEEYASRNGDGSPRAWRVDAVVATLVAGMQEQQREIADLQSQLGRRH